MQTRNVNVFVVYIHQFGLKNHLVLEQQNHLVLEKNSKGGD